MDFARAYASPITRGDFSYYPHEGLTTNRISRCASDRLYGLLTWTDTGPALRKDGKPKVHQPDRHRDETQDFYCAQCMHYGLKALKTKAAAKKELLKAFGNGREIAVPQRILDLERELKAEYAAANVAAKEEYEQEKKARAEAERNRQVKRKRAEDEMLEEISEAREKSNKRPKNAKSPPLDINKVAARYIVVAPYLRDNYGSSYDNDSYTLVIAPSASGKEVYGEFKFGAFEGYLRSTSIDKAARTIRFHWRGRETGEGESTFGDGNTMTITFIDDKTFEGDVEGDMLSRCEITGRYDAERSRNKVFQKSVEGWRYQYESLNEDNYERERVGRWH